VFLSSEYVERARVLHPHHRNHVPFSPEWLHEIKFDGYRLRVERNGDRVRLITKGGYDWSKPFPLIVEAALRRSGVASQFCAAVSDTLAKLFSAHDVITLKRRALSGFGGAYRTISMFELTAAFIAAFSASIFTAHVVEAYLARRTG
jgi:hypothetical protein